MRLAETVNADEMVWSPTSGFWLLPADEDEAVALGDRFDEAIAALFEACGFPPLYAFADDSLAGDEFCIEGKSVSDVSTWLSAHFRADAKLQNYDGENGPGLMALVPGSKMLITLRTEDEDELLLEWHGTEKQVAAGITALELSFGD